MEDGGWRDQGCVSRALRRPDNIRLMRSVKTINGSRLFFWIRPIAELQEMCF